MSKAKQIDKRTEREIHAKAMEEFLARGGKIEQIENGKSGQTFKSASNKEAAKPAFTISKKP